MKWILRVLAGITFCAFAADLLGAEASGVPFDEVLSSVQQTLIKIRDVTETDSLPALQSVELDVRASLVREGGGAVKVVILELGTHASAETTQEIKLTLAPPRPGDRSEVARSVAPLADAIIEAARAARKAATRDPPLHLAKLEATIAFAIEKDASGSGGFRLLPITVDLGGKVQQSDIQRIALTFGKTD
jgi:hypothetical protein